MLRLDSFNKSLYVFIIFHETNSFVVPQQVCQDKQLKGKKSSCLSCFGLFSFLLCLVGNRWSSDYQHRNMLLKAAPAAEGLRSDNKTSATYLSVGFIRINSVFIGGHINNSGDQLKFLLTHNVQPLFDKHSNSVIERVTFALFFFDAIYF